VRLKAREKRGARKRPPAPTPKEESAWPGRKEGQLKAELVEAEREVGEDEGESEAEEWDAAE